jgi:hypothetical protein
MSNKKQTAVEWLESLYYPSYIPKEILDKAKEMEKQQIKDAYSEGDVNGIMDNRKMAEQYYKETYKDKL